MPRIRSIHPDICISQTMAVLSAPLERTFTRLWTHCDDEGRCKDNPRLIKAAIYPLHDEQTFEVVDAELGQLELAGLLYRYKDEEDGQGYIQIRSWDQYQKPQKPTPSKHPAPIGLPEESRSFPEKDAVGEGVGEGVGVGEGEGVIALRARDPIWDALIDFGFSPPTNDGARGRWNKACKLLRQSGATPDEIFRRAASWPLHFGDAELTEIALANHWDRLSAPPLRGDPARIEEYQDRMRAADYQHRAERLEKGLPG